MVQDACSPFLLTVGPSQAKMNRRYIGLSLTRHLFGVKLDWIVYHSVALGILGPNTKLVVISIIWHLLKTTQQKTPYSTVSKAFWRS